MAGLNFRNPINFLSGMTNTGAVTNTSTTKLGTLGSNISKINFGVLTVTSPSFAATATASSLAVSHSPFPNVAAGDKVFVTTGSNVNGCFIASASATAASTIEVIWMTTGCTAVAESTAISLQYLAIS